MKNDTASNMGIDLYKEVDGEEYMNENQVAHIESILLAWRQSLI